MVLIRTMMLLALAFGLLTPPSASAHKNHQQSAATAPQPPAEADGAGASSHLHPAGAGDAAGAQAEPALDFPARLSSWLGRMHPFAVHFPIALFPVALVALIVARRRGEPAPLVRALVIVGGIGSAVAATLGWLNGGLTIDDADTILMLHRWLGTLVGLLGAAIAWWAWRRPAAVDRGPMVGALALIVAALFVQGFLGASVTHGIEHLLF